MASLRGLAGVSVVVVTALVSGLCACTPTWTPKAAPVAVPTTLRTICLESVDAGFELPGLEPRLQSFAVLVGTELTGQGYGFVPGEVVLPVLQKAYSRHAIHDPATGARRDDRYAAARREVLDTLKKDHGCDAVLSVRIVTVRSPMSFGIAKWDGVEESVQGTDVLTAGWVTALSAWFTIRDLEDREIFFGTGGLQLVTGFEQQSMWHEPEVVGAGYENILAKAETNRRSVWLALGPLLRKQSTFTPPFH